MGNGIYNAVAGSIGQVKNLDVLANNLSHVGTPGFKADVLLFEQKLADAEGGRHTVDTPRTAIRMSQGSLRKTDSPLDFGIQGEGFFVVEGDQGPRLTRSGRMVMGQDRLLRTTTGHRVYGESGFIRIPTPGEVDHNGPITVDKSGAISIGDLDLGTLKRVSVPTESLTKAGYDQFKTTVPFDEMPPATKGTILQGHIEQANVNPVVAMTQIISVQRTYEALQQVVKTYRDVDGQSIRRAR